MVTKEAYLKDPCKTCSLPFWKYQVYQIPENIKIIHQDELISKQVEGTSYQLFFRYFHDLKEITPVTQLVEPIDFETDLEELAEMINLAYESEGIKVNLTKVTSWMKHTVFDPDLWVKITRDGKIVASGIAEYDPDTKEGILEWIQVLPEYSNQGFGKQIVNHLLQLLAKKADFATVSGNLDNIHNPQKLYRKCGFTGEDVWVIITE